LKILVVDDDELNQRMMRVILSHDGHEVLMASNGLEAFNLVKHQDFDIILMDLQMPILDGIETSRLIREWENGRKHTFIVALTASYLPEKGQELFDVGVDNYISKPFDLEHLRQILKYSHNERRVIVGTTLDAAAIKPEFDSGIGLKRVGGDEETYKELLGDFIHELPGKLEFLHASLLNRDFEVLVRAAHNLKGVSANLGLLQLSEYADRIENHDGIHHFKAIEDILVDMETAAVILGKNVSVFLSKKKLETN